MDQNDTMTDQGVETESNLTRGSQSEKQAGQETNPMESLLEEQGIDLVSPKSGEIRTGVIASLGENEILVSIGTKSEGVISGREFDQIPAEERSALHVGAEIPVYVISPEDSNGNVVLSYTRAREAKDWEKAEQLLTESRTLESKIIGYNKGGLLVPLGKLRGFVPASQISLMRKSSLGVDSPEDRWAKMVGEDIFVRVIEVDRERHRLILSERAALQETRETLKDRLLDELNEGDIRTGRVTSVAEFGAFVNIDGADGLVHLSEISWERVKHPNEVLKVGQEVQVKVISIDRERRRIGLSLRQLQPDPWMEKVEHLKEGQLIEAKITHLTKFGAFARLGEDLEGLIHISELSEQRVNHPKEVVKEGDELTLRVIKIDPERRRIGLSKRKVDSPAYSDFDWRTALAEEVEGSQEAEAPQVAAEVSEEVAAEVSEEVAAEVSEGVAAEVSEGVAAEVSEGVAAEVSEGVAAEVSEEVAAEVSEEVAAEVSEEVAAEVSEEVASAEDASAELTEVEESVPESSGTNDASEKDYERD